MEFPLLKIMREVKKEIGPLLKSLDLRPKLSSRDWGVNVAFLTGDGSFSPVEIQISKATIAGEGWRQSSLITLNYIAIDVGHNGWLAHENCGGSNARGLPDGAQSAWRKIGEAIADLRVVQVGPEKPFYIKNEQFVAMYKAVERALDDGYRYECQRVDGSLSFTFEDSQQRQWRIAFQGKKARVYVDGEFDRSFARGASDVVARYITGRTNGEAFERETAPSV